MELGVINWGGCGISAHRKKAIAYLTEGTKEGYW